LKQRLLNGLVLITFLASMPAWGATYRYVDEKGRVIYSDTIPSQQAGRGHKELGKQGQVVKEVERTALTPEERAQVEARRKAAEDARQKILTAERRDRALLSSYTSPEEIDLVRDRALELEQLRITSLQTQMNYASEKLANANAEIAKRKGIPSKVHAQLRDEAESDLTSIAQRLGQAKANLEAIRTKYDADKLRFKELKGLR